MWPLLLALLTACAREVPPPVDPEACATPECAACAVAGFYGLEGIEALVSAIEPRWCPSYEDAVDFLFLELDRDDRGEVECVYTGRRVRVDGRRPDPRVFNTEHSWPQARGAGSLPARCDLHHLYPTAAVANTIRGAWPYGEVVGAVRWAEGGSKLGADADGNVVFEPRDAHKGNVARSMVYFASRYDRPLTSRERAMYDGWHALDPVDEAELTRTFAIAGRQDVANPYVVCPDLFRER